MPLTTPDREELRSSYIQDKVDEAATPKVYLSSYNKGYRAQFVSDDTLDAIADEIDGDKAEELDRVEATKYRERLRAADDDATAAAAGTAARKGARLRLIRARVRRMMLRDSAFVASLNPATASSIMAEWRREITEDENFARVRQGGFASIQLLRR
jgi:hypothetical protein